MILATALIGRRVIDQNQAKEDRIVQDILGIENHIAELNRLIEQNRANEARLQLIAEKQRVLNGFRERQSAIFGDLNFQTREEIDRSGPIVNMTIRLDIGQLWLLSRMITDRVDGQKWLDDGLVDLREWMRFLEVGIEMGLISRSIDATRVFTPDMMEGSPELIDNHPLLFLLTRKGKRTLIFFDFPVPETDLLAENEGDVLERLRSDSQ